VTNLGRLILVWLFRHLTALVLILVILIVGRYALPPAIDWARTELAAARTAPAQRSAHAEARERFDAWASERSAQARADAAGFPSLTEVQLRARRARIEPALVEQRTLQLSGAHLALAAAGGRTDRIFAHYRAGAEIALLGREREAIDALLAIRGVEDDAANLQARRAGAVRELHESHRRWSAAHDRVRALERRPLADARNLLCRTARPAIGCDNYRALVVARVERDSALAANRRARATIAAVDRAAAALRSAASITAEAADAFAAQRRAMDERMAQIERAAAGNWLLWVSRPVRENLPTALLILAVAIFAPMLVKALLYFGVAPLAARRPPIRLLSADRGEVAMESAASAVSQQVAVDFGRELLILPEAVQSTPHRAAKRTQWLLDWRMPLSSLASGMAALIRIRSAEPDFVLVSATADPLAEIALVRVGGGSALVLKPRALRGLVQAAGRPVRITRHWRLGHLSAWLTLQFRYLVFHGPCTLIVQGTRGVRLERAGAGRGVNQAATIGFSAGLDYSVRRSEAFGAYLIGRQELFNDSFGSAAGWYLYEEMPREGEARGLWGRGLRGLGDAFLKVFGL
jgi:hypothetical protein